MQNFDGIQTTLIKTGWISGGPKCWRYQKSCIIPDLSEIMLTCSCSPNGKILHVGDLVYWSLCNQFLYGNDQINVLDEFHTIINSFTSCHLLDYCCIWMRMNRRIVSQQQSDYTSWATLKLFPAHIHNKKRHAKTTADPRRPSHPLAHPQVTLIPLHS